MESLLARLVDSFGENPTATGRAIRALYETDPQEFRGAAVRLLKAVREGPGYDYLIILLLRDDFLHACLLDSSLFTLEEAVQVARSARRVDPQMAVHLARQIAADAEEGGDAGADGARQLRLLGILEAGSQGPQHPLMLARLQHHPDARVRSKAVLMIGRATKNPAWAERQMSADESRVRANAVEAMWGVPGRNSRALLWQAAADVDNRVAGNALVGLYRCDEIACIPLLLQMAAHDSPRFRTTAAWAMGEVEDPRFLAHLQQLEQDAEEAVRLTATRASGRIGRRVARAAAQGSVRLRVARVMRMPSGAMELDVVALSEQGKLISGIPPTGFAVWQEEELVADYAVTWRERRELMVTGFAFPRWIESNDSFRTVCEQALGTCLRYRRRPDWWAVTRYRPECPPPVVAPPKSRTPERDRLFGVEFELLAAEEDAQPAAAPEPLRLSTDGEWLKAAIRGTGDGEEARASIVHALRRLVATLKPVRAARYLIVIGAPQSGSSVTGLAAPELLDLTATQLQGTKISLHAILPAAPGAEAAEFFRYLAQRTEGSISQAPGDEAIPELVETVYLNLLASYRITWRPDANLAAGPAGQTPRVKLVTCCEQGYGETVFPQR
jgi:hypothetical protein